MIESLLESVKETVTTGLEKVSDILGFKLPDFIEKSEPEVNDAVLKVRAETAAQSVSSFFGLPNAPIMEGDSIGVYTNMEGTVMDDVFEYSLDQFKDMDCTSFEDMTKVWAHECGHRILQNYFPSGWTDELGADFFAGVRSEMLGLPRGEFEEALANTGPSESHPGGDLRMQAMDYGRFTVQQMREMGIEPTWENCIAAFQMSPFVGLTFENTVLGIDTSALQAVGEVATTEIPAAETNMFNSNLSAQPQYETLPGGIVVVTDIFGGTHQYYSMDTALALTDVFSGLPCYEFGTAAAGEIDTDTLSDVIKTEPEVDPFTQKILNRANEANEYAKERDVAVDHYHDAKRAGDYAEMAKWESVANDYQAKVDTAWGGFFSYGLDHKAPGID